MVEKKQYSSYEGKWCFFNLKKYFGWISNREDKRELAAII